MLTTLVQNSLRDHTEVVLSQIPQAVHAWVLAIHLLQQYVPGCNNDTCSEGGGHVCYSADTTLADFLQSSLSLLFRLPCHHASEAGVWKAKRNCCLLHIVVMELFADLKARDFLGFPSPAPSCMSCSLHSKRVT